MKKSFLILILSLFCFTNQSFSETLYLFSSLGVSDYEIGIKDKSEINNKLTKLGFASATTSANTNNLAYSLGFGLNIPLKFSVEGSYANLGKISFSSTTTSPSETLSADVQIKGLNIDLLKNIGPLAFSAGFMKVDETVKISSSQGSIDVPVDEMILPKIGASINFNNYRFKINRIYITPNSHINTFMIGYIINLL
jgi:hypothetical protein